MLGMTQIVAENGRKSFLFGIEDADYGMAYIGAADAALYRAWSNDVALTQKVKEIIAAY